MRTSELNVTINVATVAKLLAKETTLTHSQALNVVAKACGREDIGSLMASKESSKDQIKSDKAYLFVRVTVVNGSFEDTHRAVFESDEGESPEEFKRRAMQYALFFYDDLYDYADDMGLEPEEADECLDRCIAQYEEEGWFNNAGGELTIKDILVQSVTVEHYNAYKLINAI